MRRIAAGVVLALVVGATAPAAAQSGGYETGTPDGRARVRVEGAWTGNGGHLGTSGDVGAFGWDNRLEGSTSHGRFTNPPMGSAFAVSEEHQGLEYEEIFGPRIANTTIGTGGITEGIDVHGRLVGLNWPGPGHHDHVNFVQVTRRWRNQGAPANAGSFGGVVLGGEASWIHPESGWVPLGQSYASPDGQTVVTRMGRGGVTVEITDVVHPTLDVVARNFRFEGATPQAFAHYANMNPSTSRVPRVPSVFDGLADNVSDFATVLDGDAMLHFRPYTADPASATVLDPAAAGPGVYIAVAGDTAPSSHQAGLEAAGFVRAEAEGTPLLDPYYDFTDDAGLSRSPAAGGKTAGALLWDGAAESRTVYIAAGHDRDEAIASLDQARAQGFAAVRAASEAYWADWLDGVRLPPEGTDVSQRALMLIRTAQDRTSGAIVANATAQTPYRQDWVRDGAFFNYALLLAGKTDMVEHHNEFYRGVSRPGGTWDSFYYTDGAEAGFVFPYEVDSQAFALWALWLPFEFDPGKPLDADTYRVIRETADALMVCRDPSNDMQCYAPEDDGPPGQGAQGAATVYLALEAAADAAGLRGETDDAQRWRERAGELRGAAIANLCDATTCQGGRGGVYLAWPSRLLSDHGDEDLLAGHLVQYATMLDDRVNRIEPLLHGNFQYPMEPILALAPLTDDPRLDEWVAWLTDDVAEPGVLHYGERIFYCGGQAPFCADGREYLQGVGFPHIWSGAEMYLAAAFVHGVTNCPAGQARIGEAVCR